MIYALLAAAFAADDGAPELGAGVILQGIRPGLVVEAVRPFAVKRKKRLVRTHALVPTVSAWVHPSHYIPVQAHIHYAALERARSGFLIETSVGVGGTYVMNARPTFKIKDGDLKRVPLAGSVVFSPGLGLGVGSSSEKRVFLARVRINQWFGWQQGFALSWNLELVLRVKKEK